MLCRLILKKELCSSGRVILEPVNWMIPRDVDLLAL